MKKNKLKDIAYDFNGIKFTDEEYFFIFNIISAYRWGVRCACVEIPFDFNKRNFPYLYGIGLIEKIDKKTYDGPMTYYDGFSRIGSSKFKKECVYITVPLNKKEDFEILVQKYLSCYIKKELPLDEVFSYNPSISLSKTISFLEAYKSLYSSRNISLVPSLLQQEQIKILIYESLLYLLSAGNLRQCFLKKIKVRQNTVDIFRILPIDLYRKPINYVIDERIKISEVEPFNFTKYAADYNKLFGNKIKAINNSLDNIIYAFLDFKCTEEFIYYNGDKLPFTLGKKEEQVLRFLINRGNIATSRDKIIEGTKYHRNKYSKRDDVWGKQKRNLTAAELKKDSFRQIINGLNSKLKKIHIKIKTDENKCYSLNSMEK